MKRIIALSLLLCIAATATPLSGYALPIETDPVIAVPEPVAPTPSTEEMPFEETPSVEEPPSTDEPPETLPPITEEEPTEAELLFSALYALIDAGEAEYIHLSPTPREDGLLEEVCNPLMEGTPEFFHLDSISVETTPLTTPDEEGNLYQYRFIPKYNLTRQELADARAFVAQKVNAILSGIPEDALTLQKLLYLHDYICVNFAYDSTESIRDIYRFLQIGKGDCQSYAKLYAYLLDQLSIENQFLSSAEMNHVWNLVNLDGHWYHIDVAWDDPSIDQAGRALHTNFLRSDNGIAETGHTGFDSPYPCTSTLYESSFLPDLSGEVIYHLRYGYAVSRSQRVILQIDLQNLTSTPVVDLSDLRWQVWNKPESLWKEQYLNLYTDGQRIYFNGPASVWSYDPELSEVELLYEFDSSNGYLYSLRGQEHQLTCTVSQAPGTAMQAVEFTTPHIFASEGGGFISTEACMICDHTEAVLAPEEDDFFTACISTRPAGDGLHDLRLTLLTDTAMLSASAPLTVRLSLFNGDEERFITCILSAETHESFLVYECIYANGLEHSVIDGYDIYGLILVNLADDSYDRVEVTVTCQEQEIYRASLTAQAIFNPTAEPDQPESPETEEEIPDFDETIEPDTEDEPETDLESESDPESDSDDIIEDNFTETE